MAKTPGKAIRTTMAALLITVAVPTGVAYAGFEWKPAPRQPAAPEIRDAAPAAAPAVPAPAVDQAPLSEMPPPPAPQPFVAAPEIAASAPMTAEPAPAQPSLMPVTAPPAPQAASSPMPMITPQPLQTAATPAAPTLANQAVVTGFGRDMPLVLAMRQIVPADYAYSFDNGVNAGLRIDWDGGRPWQDTLDGTLSHYGLKASVVDRTVRVMPVQAPMPATAPVEPQPQAAAAPMATPVSPAQPPVTLPVITAAAPVPEEKKIVVPSDISVTTAQDPIHTSVPEPELAPKTDMAAIPAPVMDGTEQSSGTEPDTYIYAAPKQIEASGGSDGSQSYPHRQKPDHPPVETFPVAENAPAQTEPSTVEPQTMGKTVVADSEAIAATDAEAAKVEAANKVSADAESTNHVGDAAADITEVAEDTADKAEIQEPVAEAPPPPAPEPQIMAALPPEASSVPSVETASDTDTPTGIAIAHEWKATEGQSLKSVLQKWCKDAGVELYWTGLSDYKLPKDIEAKASFTDAVRAVLMAYDDASQRPVGNLHTGDSRTPATLIIKDYNTAVN